MDPVTNPTSPNTARELDDAMARALAYTDAVGLSDGTDRPARSAAEVDLEQHRGTAAAGGYVLPVIPADDDELRRIEDELEARDLYREGRWIG